MANPPHEATDERKAQVSALKSFGITDEDIATYIGIDQKTLVKHYKRELETALTKANAQVAHRLFNKATAQDDLQAQIFWLKTRGRWRTADKEHEVKEISDVLINELKELRDKLAEKSKSEY
jgi:hypothetical protein